jgi:hypothetical protein
VAPNGLGYRLKWASVTALPCNEEPACGPACAISFAHDRDYGHITMLDENGQYLTSPNCTYTVSNPGGHAGCRALGVRSRLNTYNSLSCGTGGGPLGDFRFTCTNNAFFTEPIHGFGELADLGNALKPWTYLVRGLAVAATGGKAFDRNLSLVRVAGNVTVQFLNNIGVGSFRGGFASPPSNGTSLTVSNSPGLVQVCPMPGFYWTTLMIKNNSNLTMDCTTRHGRTCSGCTLNNGVGLCGC